MTRSYDTGQLLANHLGGLHLEKAHALGKISKTDSVVISTF